MTTVLREGTGYASQRHSMHKEPFQVRQATVERGQLTVMVSLHFPLRTVRPGICSVVLLSAGSAVGDIRRQRVWRSLSKSDLDDIARQSPPALPLTNGS